MMFEDAVQLELHISRCAPEYKPQTTQIGNGEWVVKLANSKIVWSVQDWNENFVGQPVKQEVQVSA